MNTITRTAFIACATASLMGVSGCTTSQISKSEDKTRSTEAMMHEKMRQASTMTRTDTSVQMIDALYVAGAPFRLSERDTLPKFFETRVSFNQLDPVSFQELISMVSADISTRIVLTADAIAYLEGLSGESIEGLTDVEVRNVSESTDMAKSGLVGSELKFSFDYTGTIAGLLDSVITKANLFWKWDRNHISVFRMETKHYVFDGDSSEEKFDASISGARAAGENAGSGSTGSSSSSHSTTVTRSSGSIFDDIKDSLTAMVSEDGRFSISKQQGIITVTDTPEIQSNIEDYIIKINKIVNKRIAVRTEVFEIVSDDSGEFGIDWHAVFTGSQAFSFDMATAIGGASGVPMIELGVLKPTSNWNGSQAFLSALNTLANVTLVTSSTSYTTNGKPVPVQVADERSYLKGMTIETDESGRDKVSLQAGSVLSGYSMSLTPRVNSEGDIDLQFAVDMSQVNQINTLQVNDESMIQLPDRTFKNFLQRVSIDSGNTVMLSGFERTEYASNTDSIGNKHAWFAGGKKSGGKKKVMTMIMITPYIMAK